VYTMKTIHMTTQATQYPQFWNEEWLQIAIDELDKRKMTPDERFSYERRLAINAESIRVVNAQIKEAVETEVTRETALQAARKLLRRGRMTVTEIAEDTGVAVETVEQLKREIETTT
jgi:hypothetical protein